MSASYIYGPIISTGEMNAQRQLFETVFGMKSVGEQSFDKDEVQSMWGVEGYTASSRPLKTSKTNSGVYLLEFAPPPAEQVRRAGSSLDCDALKVIDFYAPDVEMAAKYLAAAGYSFSGEIAEYDFPEGKITEGHVNGPDGVICAVLSGPPEYFRRYVQKSLGSFSEILSVSGPVSDPQPVLEFYNDVLSLGVVDEYTLVSTAFERLVGSGDRIHLHGFNVGTHKREPYLGIIHYGLPDGSYNSLMDASVFPNRGLIGVIVVVENVETVLDTCRHRRDSITSALTRAKLDPFGVVKTACIRSPHGIIHQLVECIDVSVDSRTSTQSQFESRGSE